MTGCHDVEAHIHAVSTAQLPALKQTSSLLLPVMLIAQATVNQASTVVVAYMLFEVGSDRIANPHCLSLAVGQIGLGRQCKSSLPTAEHNTLTFGLTEYGRGFIGGTITSAAPGRAEMFRVQDGPTGGYHVCRRGHRRQMSPVRTKQQTGVEHVGEQNCISDVVTVDDMCTILCPGPSSRSSNSWPLQDSGAQGHW